MDNKTVGFAEGNQGDLELNKVAVLPSSSEEFRSSISQGADDSSALYRVEVGRGEDACQVVVSGVQDQASDHDLLGSSQNAQPPVFVNGHEGCKAPERTKFCESCIEKDRVVQLLVRRNMELEQSYDQLRRKIRKTHDFLRYLADESDAAENSHDMSDVLWSTPASTVTHMERSVNHEATVMQTPKSAARSSGRKRPQLGASPAKTPAAKTATPATGTGQTSALKMDLASAQQYDLKPLIPGGTLYVSELLRETSVANAGQSRKRLARILARQLFSEETLANSSVRGQTNKPGLDPSVINDIIEYCMAEDTLGGAPAVSSKDIVVSLNALCGECARRASAKSSEAVTGAQSS